MSSAEPENEKSEEQIQDAQIAKAIDDFRDRILALRAFAVAQLKHARENQQAAEAELDGRIFAATTLWGLNESQPVIRARALKEYQEAIGEQSSMRALPHDKSLTEMIFIYTFAAFDFYLGNILRLLFSIKPEFLSAFDSTEDEARNSNRPSGRVVGLFRRAFFVKR